MAGKDDDSDDGDGDDDGDIYIMMKCMFLTLLFIPKKVS